MYLSLLQCGWHTVTFFQKITAWNGGKKSNFTVEKADKKVPYPGIKVNINSHVMLITYILHVLSFLLKSQEASTTFSFLIFQMKTARDREVKQPDQGH